MTETLDAYLAAVRERLATDDEQTALILAELRGHMEEKLSDLAAKEPGTPRADLERRVVEDFGDPADLAVAYDTQGSMVLRDRQGDILLVLSRDVAEAGRRLGRGVATFSRGTKDRARSFAAGWQAGWEEGRPPTDDAGHDLPDDQFLEDDKEAPAARAQAAGHGAAVATRQGLRSTRRVGSATRRGVGNAARGFGTATRGFGTALKGLFIGLAIILTGIIVIGGIAGVVLFDDIVDLVEANEIESVADLHHGCDDAACTMNEGSGTFFVNADAKRLMVNLHVHRVMDTNGTFWLRVADPQGNEVFDSTYADSNQTMVDEALGWGPAQGTWRYNYGMDRFQGHVDFTVHVRGV